MNDLKSKTVAILKFVNVKIFTKFYFVDYDIDVFNYV